MIDWSNPTVQGAFLAGLFGLGAAMVAALAGVLGAVIGARIGAAASRRDHEARRGDERQGRIREWNLRRLADTKDQLISIADGFLALMDKNVARGRQLLARVDEKLLGNARLVGDSEPIRELAAAVAVALHRSGGGGLMRAVRFAATDPFTDADRSRVRDARAWILNAIERQEERALRDEPLSILEPDELSDIPALIAAIASTGTEPKH